MSEEVLVNVAPQQTRVAVVDQGILLELHIDHASKPSLVGNIYNGKIVRVLPGLQSAFIDIGLDRTAFLHFDDISSSKIDLTIEQVLIPGQIILVQVSQDPVGTKGARLSAKLALSSRYLVMLPDAKNITVAQTITDQAECERLKNLLVAGADCTQHGYIIRTAAEGVESLEQDKLYLQEQWRIIMQKMAQEKPCSMVYQELPLVLRTVRDLIDTETSRIVVDSPSVFAQIQKYFHEFNLNYKCSIEQYKDAKPIFAAYKIEAQLNEALQPKVSLKSGGYLIIDQNEALTTIDVNTGTFVGRNDAETTMLTTNLEAAKEIARQLRVRNIGGIIIIDFINLEQSGSKEQVLQQLKTSLAHDSVKTVISPTSSLGLVQMTRKRTRESLLQLLCDVCPTCSGRGYIKNYE